MSEAELLARIERLERMMHSLGWEKALDNRLRCSRDYAAMKRDLDGVAPEGAALSEREWWTRHAIVHPDCYNGRYPHDEHILFGTPPLGVAGRNQPNPNAEEAK